MANSRCHQDNACGFKGVYRKYDKWCANIRFKYKLIVLGYFDTPEAAALAHATAAYGLWGPFARPHWRDLLAEMRGASCIWRKPKIEELSLNREEMDRIFAA